MFDLRAVVIVPVDGNDVEAALQVVQFLLFYVELCESDDFLLFAHCDGGLRRAVVFRAAGFYFDEDEEGAFASD